MCALLKRLALETDEYLSDNDCSVGSGAEVLISEEEEEGEEEAVYVLLGKGGDSSRRRELPRTLRTTN